METADVKMCSKCKKTKNIIDFTKGNNILKTCLRCREIFKKSKNKNKCEHNRHKQYCKLCGGSSICHHNRRKSKCKLCGGSSICEHNREKQSCKLCGGSSICEHNRYKNHCKLCGDEIKITIIHMLSSSKKADKKYNRYDLTNFIDKCFVKNLIEDCEDKCYYCKCELQYINYTGNLATIERIDNKLGHIKGNCVIACRTCNVSKVGNKL
jgi:hypothetical protein